MSYNENSSDMPPLFPSPSMLALAYGIATTEIFVHFATASIASINLAILVPTKILHQNLKFILLCQSVTIFLSEVIRLAMIGQKFVLNDIFNPTSVGLQAILLFFGLFRKSAAHVLLIERMMATIFFRTYEKWNSKYFTFGWLIIVATIATTNSFEHQSWTLGIINFFTFGLSILLSIAELIAIILMGMHNRAIHQKFILEGQRNQNMLSQRYQLMENIQTCEQLRPAFIFFIIGSMLECFPLTIFIFNINISPYLKSILLALWIVFSSTIGAAIEIIVIIHHPLLKKRFNLLLKRYLCRRMFTAMNVHPMETTASQEKEKAEKAEKEMEEHFRMLKHIWDQ